MVGAGALSILNFCKTRFVGLLHPWDCRMRYIKPTSWVFRCNALRDVAVLVQAARVRILHLGGAALGPRCALSVEELICDLVVEPQPIDRVCSADAACRACWLLDSRDARMGCSASAGLVSDGRH